MNCKILLCFLVYGFGSFAHHRLLADTFGSGADTFEIEFVPIGSPGNPPYSVANPAGAVNYHYRIGKYEISEQMIDRANAESAAAGNALNITHDGRGPNFPATSISWYEAARFVNWLNTSTNNSPAYKFDGLGDFQLWDPNDPGYDPANLYRNKLARYFLPTLSEWHKAAYYDPNAGVYYDYPTGSDSVPDGISFPGDPVFDAVFNDGGNNLGPNVITDVGVASPYGTFGQGGNVIEWEETAGDRLNDESGESRGFRGGDWGFGVSLLHAANRNGIGPSSENISFGFRVVNIPEPCSLWLLLVGFLGLPGRIRRGDCKSVDHHS